MAAIWLSLTLPLSLPLSCFFMSLSIAGRCTCLISYKRVAAISFKNSPVCGVSKVVHTENNNTFFDMFFPSFYLNSVFQLEN